MLTTYRIFKTKHSAKWFDGEGAYRFGGRWNSRGTRLVYTSASLSLASLEMLVNLNSEGLMQSYSYAAIKFDEGSVLNVEEIRRLPSNWRDSPPPLVIQRIGDEWAESKLSLAMRVPTAVLPGEYNYLLNVEHPDFASVELGRPQGLNFDKRLYNRGLAL